MPDPATLGRRAQTRELPAPPRATGEPVPRLVDSPGRIETHGTKTRRSWRKRRIGMDATTGRIVAAILTDRAAEDASQVGPLLDQIAAPVDAFIADGADDRAGVDDTLHECRRSSQPKARPGTPEVCPRRMSLGAKDDLVCFPDLRAARSRRADVIGIFPNEQAILRLVGAVLLEQNGEGQRQYRYMQIAALAELAPAISQPAPVTLSPRPPDK